MSHAPFPAGGVAVLAALEHCQVQEVRNLASSTLSMQSALDAHSLAAVAGERGLQEQIGALLCEVRVSTMVPAALEEAFRMVPRSDFLPPDRVSTSHQKYPCLLQLAKCCCLSLLSLCLVLLMLRPLQRINCASHLHGFIRDQGHCLPARNHTRGI